MVSLLAFLQQQQSSANTDAGFCGDVESGEQRDLISQDFSDYGGTSVHDESVRKIRFQVVVWYVGPVDVVLGKVEMKFRVTIFWNAPSHMPPTDQVGYGLDNPWHKKVWTMHGRQRAFERNLSRIMDQDSRLVYVPPVSILNAVDLETVGDPEVCLIDETAQLMKWTCLYKASLLQDNIQVSNFPHDGHDLVLRLGVLKHRQAHKRWDKNKWKLALATAEDTRDTIHTPHGLIVDHVKVPGFSYTGGLEFEFVPLHYGIQEEGDSQDQCLQVKLRVNRDASYYNCNIIPLLAMLNFVAVSTLTLDASSFGARGEMILATSFVEIGIRMTVDSRLPLVGYQIKIQVVLNNFFYGLIFLGLESSLVYVFNQQYGIDTTFMDQAAVILELVHLLIALLYYYCWF